MGQELSIPSAEASSSSSHSILEPLSVDVIESPLSCSQRRQRLEEEQQEIVDPELIRAIMALTEQDATIPMHSYLRSGGPAAASEEEQRARLRAEADADFAKWTQTKRVMKRESRLSRHDSSASTASSSFCQIVPPPLPTAAAARNLAYRHTYIHPPSSSLAQARRDSF